MSSQFYEVIVSNVGKVLEGCDAFKANSAYWTYVRLSERGVGRVGGESVVLFRNGEVVKEHPVRIEQCGVPDPERGDGRDPALGRQGL